MMMRVITIMAAGILLVANTVDAQVAKTIVSNGPPTELYDIVILGDGYQASEQARFDADSLKIANYFKTASTNYPYDAYFNCFNVHTVFRASAQSGADDPSINKYVNTAYDASYGIGGVQRCIYLGTTRGRNQATADAALAPDTDGRVIVLVNDSQYGGCAANFSVSYNGSIMHEVQAHEWGHSFGLLADEYSYGKSGTYSGPEFTQPNVTNSASGNKWSKWLGQSGANSVVGAYQGASYYASGVWRPELNCKMRSNGTGFCQICREQIIRRFHQECTMIHGMQPSNPASVAQYSSKVFSFQNRLSLRPHTIEWRVDSGPWQLTNATLFQWNAGRAPAGWHTVTVRLSDTTTDVRHDPSGDLVHVASWRVLVLSGARPFKGPVEVLPSDLASTEGVTLTSFPFKETSPLRVQYAYAGTAIDPRGPVTITGISFRPDGSVTQVPGATYDFALDVSTCAKTISTLSMTFADNHGADKARVYDGKLVIPPRSLAAGPHPFVLTVPFDEPFNWDPRSGPLLVDFRHRGITAGTGVLMDVESAVTRGDMARLYWPGNPDAPKAYKLQPYACPMQLELDCDVTPKSIANREGSTASTYPFGRPTGAKMRVQNIYDELTHSFSGRHKIMRLGWRADGGAAFAGRSYDMLVTLSTGAKNLSSSISSSFSINTGSDAVTVFDGTWNAPATMAVTSGAGLFSMLLLDRSFEYDPALGSLVVDIQLRSSSNGAILSCDGTNLGTAGVGRVFSTLSDTATTGTPNTFALAMCISAVPVPIVPNYPVAQRTYSQVGVWRSLGGTRSQFLYGPTTLGTNEPVNITHLSWRAGPYSGPMGPVTFNATIDLSVSQTTLATMSTTFANNHGSNRTRVFAGHLSAPYLKNAGTTARTQITAHLAKPFRWDPSKGSLIVDIRKIGGFVGGGRTINMEAFSGNDVGHIHDLTNENASVASGPARSTAYAIQLGGEGCNAQATPYGNGCPGQRGVPVNSSVGLPWTGNRDFQLALYWGSSNSVAIAVFGFQKQVLNLASVGLPACDLLTSTALGSVGVSTDSQGDGFWKVPLPNSASLHGATFNTQWLCIDASAPGGATVSNGIEFVICH